MSVVNKNGMLALLLVALLALPPGCGGSGGESGGVDGGGGGEDVAAQQDTGGSDSGSPGADVGGASDDVGAQKDAAQEDDTVEPVESGREVASFSVRRICYGCRSVSVCGWPGLSERTGIELNVFLNNGTGRRFALERWEAAGRALPLDTCKVFVGAELDAVVNGPRGIDGMDGGTVSVGGEMSLLAPPIEVQFSEQANGYETSIQFASEEHPYEPGGTISLESEGGAEVESFSYDAMALDTFELLTPSVDEAGQIDDIATDEPLDVTWTGGEEFDDAVLIFNGYYCTNGPDTFVACHVRNDGAFTIGVDTLSQVTWPNAVEFFITMSEKHAMDRPELTDRAAWTNRSLGWLFVWWDPDAEPPSAGCEGDNIEEGFVGAACESDADCGGGCCLMEVSGHFVGNYCTRLDCSSDDDCPADARCAPQNNSFIGVPDYCAKLCDSDDDCRDAPHYVCMDDSGDGRKFCRPGLM